MRILLVEDDALLADATARGLSAAGFVVDHAGSVGQAQAALAAERFDLAVLDLGLPDADGLSLLRSLRASVAAGVASAATLSRATIPVLILTAREALADRIRAFEQGADDFLMKPFEQVELAARCRALVRRAGLAPSGRVQLGRLSIDLLGHQLTLDSRTVDLTRREWRVLESLAHNLGRVVSKDRLLQALSGWDEDLTANALETHVSRLRAKLGDAACIRSVRGLGYRLEEARANAVASALTSGGQGA